MFPIKAMVIWFHQQNKSFAQTVATNHYCNPLLRKRLKQDNKMVVVVLISGAILPMKYQKNNYLKMEKVTLGDSSIIMLI